jgi:hypothetical protein
MHPQRYMGFNLTTAFQGKYVMQMFNPRVQRSKCEECRETFDGQPIIEHEGRIIHAKCAPQ